MKLYCEDQYKRSIIQSSLSIGSLFGLILMNIVSDIKGRKFALMADLIIAIVSAACNNNIILSHLSRSCDIEHLVTDTRFSFKWFQWILVNNHQLHYFRRRMLRVNETKEQRIY